MNAPLNVHSLPPDVLVSIWRDGKKEDGRRPPGGGRKRVSLLALAVVAWLKSEKEPRRCRQILRALNSDDERQTARQLQSVIHRLVRQKVLIRGAGPARCSTMAIAPRLAKLTPAEIIRLGREAVMKQRPAPARELEQAKKDLRAWAREFEPLKDPAVVMLGRALNDVRIGMASSDRPAPSKLLVSFEAAERIYKIFQRMSEARA